MHFKNMENDTYSMAKAGHLENGWNWLSGNGWSYLLA
jgi:hypothetical protein